MKLTKELLDTSVKHFLNYVNDYINGDYVFYEKKQNADYFTLFVNNEHHWYEVITNIQTEDEAKLLMYQRILYIFQHTQKEED